MASTGSWFEPNQTYYRTTIAGQRKTSQGDRPVPFSIVGWTPEEFSVSTSANYDQKIGGGLIDLVGRFGPPVIQGFGMAAAGALGSAKVAGITNAAASALESAAGLLGNGMLAALTGVSDVTQNMTLSTWQSSSPMSISLPFIFNARRSSAKEDVHQNVVELLKLPQPWKKNIAGFNLLAGPGISFVDLIRKTETIEFTSIRIGKLLYIPVVNVESVDASYDMMVDPDGYCISARVDISMHTPFVPVREDLDIWFKTNNQPDMTVTQMLNGENTAELERVMEAAKGRLGI